MDTGRVLRGLLDDTLGRMAVRAGHYGVSRVFMRADQIVGRGIYFAEAVAGAPVTYLRELLEVPAPEVVMRRYLRLRDTEARAFTVTEAEKAEVIRSENDDSLYLP